MIAVAAWPIEWRSIIPAMSQGLPCSMWCRPASLGIEPMPISCWASGHGHCWPSRNLCRSAFLLRPLMPSSTALAMSGVRRLGYFHPRFVSLTQSSCAILAMGTPFVKSIALLPRLTANMMRPTRQPAGASPVRCWCYGVTKGLCKAGTRRRAGPWACGRNGPTRSAAKHFAAGHFFPEELPQETAKALGSFFL